MSPRYFLRVGLSVPIMLILLVSCGLATAQSVAVPTAVITAIPPTAGNTPSPGVPANLAATTVSRNTSTETTLPGFRAYLNTRYSYLLQFPQSWPTDAQAGSDAGLRFFPGQAGMDMRVYARNFSKDSPSAYSNADKPHIQYQQILLNSGKTAVLLVGRDGQNILYELVWTFGDAEGIEIHFYANIPEPFFVANERALLAVAKSIDLLPGAVTITPADAFGPTPSYPTPTPGSGVARGWQSYTNERFGFTIWFPARWPLGAEPMNGEGVSLYIGNPDLDIRVYAEYQDDADPVKLALKPGYQQAAIMLSSGRSATLITGSSGDDVILETIFVADRIVYYFDTKVSARLYNEYEPTLLKIAKSMDTK